MNFHGPAAPGRGLGLSLPEGSVVPQPLGLRRPCGHQRRDTDYGRAKLPAPGFLIQAPSAIEPLPLPLNYLDADRPSGASGQVRCSAAGRPLPPLSMTTSEADIPHHQLPRVILALLGHHANRRAGLGGFRAAGSLSARKHQLSSKASSPTSAPSLAHEQHFFPGVGF